jgi:hypothetical protein
MATSRCDRREDLVGFDDNVTLERIGQPVDLEVDSRS